MIGAVSDFLYALQRRSVRLQAADGTPEKTWLNHGLITLGAGLIGAAVAWAFWLPALLGAQIGSTIAVGCYLYREIRQWWGPRPRPDGWWWDASLDVLFPFWFASALFSPIAFLSLAVTVAAFHFWLRPVE
jgi:hypothetical protein